MIDHEEITTSVRCAGRVEDFDEALLWAVGKIDEHHLRADTIHLAISPVSVCRDRDTYEQWVDVLVVGDPR